MISSNEDSAQSPQEKTPQMPDFLHENPHIYDEESNAPTLGMTELVKEMLSKIGEDPDREGLLRTPLRVDKSMAYLTGGYRMELDKIVNNAVFTEDCNEMVVVKDIEFYSMCEHHMLPFFGTAHVAYIPDGKVIGLSKVPRIVEMYSRRLQVQERLTQQIADCVNEVLKPKGVAVVTEARHLCMMMRGVEKQGSSTIASAMLGAFKKNSETRNEFLSFVRTRTV